MNPWELPGIQFIFQISPFIHRNIFSLFIYMLCIMPLFYVCLIVFALFHLILSYLDYLPIICALSFIVNHNMLHLNVWNMSLNIKLRFHLNYPWCSCSTAAPPSGPNSSWSGHTQAWTEASSLIWTEKKKIHAIFNRDKRTEQTNTSFCIA